MTRLPFPAVLVLTLALTTPASAWTAKSLEVIADQTARLAPADLYRQLVKNRASYQIGVAEGFKVDPTLRFKDEKGRGQLDAALLQHADFAIQAIRAQRPFNEISYRLGQVVFFVSQANFPLALSSADPQLPRYSADFSRYGESALPRIRLLFYGFRTNADGRIGLPALVHETIARSRQGAPLVAREYQRIGFDSGVRAFDDRSTAYALTALAFNHAISDSAEVLRYIWLAAGGTDKRSRLPERGRAMIRLDSTRTP
jgi:hypothetical protein